MYIYLFLIIIMTSISAIFNNMGIYPILNSFLNFLCIIILFIYLYKIISSDKRRYRRMSEFQKPWIYRR